MSQEETLLDDLLLVATEELQNVNKNKYLKETDLFKNENIVLKNVSTTESSSYSVVHSGDTDSSDDEGNKNYENAKYSEYGKKIKQLLETKSSPQSTSSPSCYDKQSSSSWKSKAIFAPPNKSIDELLDKNAKQIKGKSDVYTDPIFGLRIINPLISSTVLKERMVGREAVPFSEIRRYLQVYGKEKDWVIAGVITNKSAVKTSQKGSQFCIWTITDLKRDIKTVSLFLFSGAHKLLWKTVVGTVVGILNPNVLDKKDGSKDEACLSVDNPQKVMILGQSKDFGTCKSIKKNGEKCTAIVNLSSCDFCVYHIKQEYQKCSKRSELQANFAGRGLTALRNKVLGKNEVFYAGKSYTAIPAKKSKKMEQKDKTRLNSLSGKCISITSNPVMKPKNKNMSVRKQNASRLDVSQAQRLRDIELLKKLGGFEGLQTKNNFTGKHPIEISLKESRCNALNIIDKLKEKHGDSTSQKIVYNEGTDKVPKEDFQGRLSKPPTIDESRTLAHDVISKLKSKAKQDKTSYIPKENVDQPTNLTYDIFNTDMNLNYNDADITASNKNDIATTTKLPNNTKNTVNDYFKKDALPSEIHESKLPEINSKESPCKMNIKSVINENKNFTNINITKSCNVNLNSVAVKFPVLSGKDSNSMIDLNKTITPKHMNKAKLNAIKVIQKNGPLKKANPNSVKGSGKKRPLEDAIQCENTAKKSKLAESEFISDRFKKMMAATSKHLDLLESKDDEEKEKYFYKMERKEQMEEKMANTFKVPCKAVRCLQCKYTSFSASDLCKSEKHRLKVFDAMKRFFKCGNCGNRIVSLDVVPTGLCQNCGSGKWEKTGMMKEKLCSVTHSLSIRGGEQKFTNSVATDANINLLVPDD